MGISYSKTHKLASKPSQDPPVRPSPVFPSRLARLPLFFQLTFDYSTLCLRLPVDFPPDLSFPLLCSPSSSLPPSLPRSSILAARLCRALFAFQINVFSVFLQSLLPSVLSFVLKGVRRSLPSRSPSEGARLEVRVQRSNKPYQMNDSSRFCIPEGPRGSHRVWPPDYRETATPLLPPGGATQPHTHSHAKIQTHIPSILTHSHVRANAHTLHTPSFPLEGASRGGATFRTATVQLSTKCYKTT